MNNINNGMDTEYIPFFDREGQNLNRRKLKIVSQTPDEIIVDIERCDTSTVDGTPLNATTLNNKFDEIESALTAHEFGSVVKVNNAKVDEVTFNSNPQEQITNEVNARTEADSNLQAQLTSEVNTRTSADSNLQSQITSEINTRTNLTTSLQNQITNLNNEAVKLSETQTINGPKTFDSITCNSLNVTGNIEQQEVYIPYYNNSLTLNLTVNSVLRAVYKNKSNSLPYYILKLKKNDVISLSPTYSANYFTTVTKKDGTTTSFTREQNYTITGDEIAMYTEGAPDIN